MKNFFLNGAAVTAFLTLCAGHPAMAFADAPDAHPASDHEDGSHDEADHDNGQHGGEAGDPHAHDHDHERALAPVIVQATRSGRRVQDEPIRVEVINREEIGEKAAMRPGNISMLVAETGGIRVQTTSPALGAANIRIQGLYGRYTQLLADGLPLYGGQAASLGLLQIPPTDLAQVEIIKGSASSLYGGSALGGVINLVSRRPGDEAEGEVLLNLTTEDGQDITAYGATPLSDTVGVSLTAGAHRQSVRDFDDDGWIDMAGYERWTARPRVFWDGTDGSSVYATLGYMTEQREGGTLPGRTVPNGRPFAQDQDTERLDAGLIAERPLSDAMSLHFRGSAMVQDHEHRFGTVLEDDQHESYLAETSLTWQGDRTNWVLGAALQTDSFSSDTFPAFDYDYDVPGVFAQVDHDFSELLAVSLSGRLDDHSAFGTQFSPRLSVLYRPGNWTIRGSVGEGYYAPTPFVEEIEAAGLSRLEPLSGLEEETAQTASLDVGYRQGPVETSLTLFASDVDGVTELEAFSSIPGGTPDRVRLVNQDGTTEIRGSELLLRYYLGDWKLTGSYLYLDASEPAGPGAGRQEIPLTPRHSAGFVAMWEQHGRGRLGFEAYYTGEQRLEGNPYRTESDPYLHLGILAEITTGPASWFVNAENLLDVRQTKEDPLLRRARAPSGQWTTDIWSRNDGFILNGGVRLSF
ncbi:TonB-dependent receptor [Henriciella barbarensis]|uniref:TonB-dependent receptor n=2 Tax=Henriciella barbarensis TaxID=86342 RepID=A0A399R3E1_9PROT|nr:TonB-dependent receptor [Henriciella barbarensis]RIJ26026.1 TonB-dependent receptor [Henriciella barbarensis]